MARVDTAPETIEVPSAEIPADIIGLSPGQLFRRRFLKDKFAIAGLVFLAIMTLLAIFAGAIASFVHHPVNAQYIFQMTTDRGVPKGPTLHSDAGAFIFGADFAAHDQLVWILYGARTSLIVSLSATGIEMVLGVTLGIMAGYYRGKVDTVISRLIDIFYALPTLLLILGLVFACGASATGCFGGLLKPGMGLIALAIGFFGWPYVARIIRGQVLSLREKEFVESARSLGASNRRIMFREILPNVMTPIIVYATLTIPTNILAEASLSYLGLGVPPTTPSWGNMLSEATSVYRIAWWTMVIPGVFLFLTTLAFNLVGDGLSDALDTKTG